MSSVHRIDLMSKCRKHNIKKNALDLRTDLKTQIKRGKYTATSGGCNIA